MSVFPDLRLRRLRRTESLRRMFDLPLPGPEKFMWPVFVRAGENEKEAIESMPEQFRWSVDRLPEAMDNLLEQGVRSLLVFGLPDDGDKDATGKSAASDDGVVQEAVRAVVEQYPEITVFTDVCVCAYTEHGHCGPLDAEGAVDNDAANEVLAKVAVSHARAGAHGVAPSAMMDGQVMALRMALDEADLKDEIIMSYSSKFASAMYGPFRDAEKSSPQEGDRKGYQAPYGDLKQALRESRMDEDEGADILMVKPSLFYLDIIARVEAETDLPLAAYNVSGEYSMLIATAERGFGDLGEMVRESTTALVRAGTDIVISYWASRYEEIFGRSR